MTARALQLFAVIPLFLLVVAAGTTASSSEGRTMFVLGILVVTLVVIAADVFDPKSQAIVLEVLEEVRDQGLRAFLVAFAGFVLILAAVGGVVWVAGTAAEAAVR